MMKNWKTIAKIVIAAISLLLKNIAISMAMALA